jgi:hypothetical protein
MERIAHETKYTGDVSARTRVAHIFLENYIFLSARKMVRQDGEPVGRLLCGAQPVQLTQTRESTGERLSFC